MNNNIAKVLPLQLPFSRTVHFKTAYPSPSLPYQSASAPPTHHYPLSIFALPLLSSLPISHRSYLNLVCHSFISVTKLGLWFGPWNDLARIFFLHNSFISFLKKQKKKTHMHTHKKTVLWFGSQFLMTKFLNMVLTSKFYCHIFF